MKDRPTRDPQGTELKAVKEKIEWIRERLSQFEPKPAPAGGAPDRPVESETEAPLERET